jgi:hypothetical protein
VLSEFIGQNKQRMVFKFHHIAAIPSAFGHLQRMRLIQKLSYDGFSEFYYGIYEEVWEVLNKHRDNIFHEYELYE